MKISRILKDLIKNTRLYKYYAPWHKRAQNREQWYIYMADGKMLHGGLSDRLCGLVSTYCYCKEHGKVFKAYFKSPYNLESFLLPNKYDWRVDESEISYNCRDSCPVYISCNNDNILQRKMANAKLNKQYKQIHIYTNMRYFQTNFSSLFGELFRPTPLLSDAIKRNIQQIGFDYISITFRFQQLLGDFEEGRFPILSEGQRDALINNCLKKVDEIHRQHSLLRVLVTSDSHSFLERAKKIDYVYIIPGNLVHMDFTNVSNMNVHLKSFTDFFIISKAQKAYLVYSDVMYRSSFAKTASLVFNTLYEEIEL